MVNPNPAVAQFECSTERTRESQDITGRSAGRAVRVRPDDTERRRYAAALREALHRCADRSTPESGGCRFVVAAGKTIALGAEGSDFIDPDFLVHLPGDRRDAPVLDTDVQLAGEVIPFPDGPYDFEFAKAYYACSGIPWYWEVLTERTPARIATVRAYALEIGHGVLADGVSPVRPANYLVAGEWHSSDTDGIAIGFPFPIEISWAELEF
ncbi:Uma2 family endonuclease [Nocardia aurantia]|uniref:Uma2 family endonuclease n=1 Tax=Nocardia aurantia TaxID=2585199 RepID=A0A7K0DL52_9NOCA|nr:Uma2 family endonuclease [Nocardia aurantia]MQY26381.1 hypothetical protein [Nocardia aurantia]